MPLEDKESWIINFVFFFFSFLFYIHAVSLLWICFSYVFIYSHKGKKCFSWWHWRKSSMLLILSIWNSESLSIIFYTLFMLLSAILSFILFANKLTLYLRRNNTGFTEVERSVQILSSLVSPRWGDSTWLSWSVQWSPRQCSQEFYQALMKSVFQTVPTVSCRVFMAL